MAATALDWATLLGDRTPQQWMTALGHPAAAQADDAMVAAMVAGVAAQLERLPRGWYVWRGVGPQRPWYGRRPRTSPPRWVWGWTLEQVATRAACWQSERSKGDG
jgi:hypothetical protein